jgi:hypothetical protein
MENNEEFLIIHKILMSESIPDSNIINLEEIQRISLFDELQFSNDLNKIKFLELSQEIKDNFMVLAIDGTVHKYDIASKELLF